MNIYKELPQLTNSVLTIGCFDGMHLGHQYLVNEIQKKAKEYQTEEYIISFDPHPRMILNHSEDFRLLMSYDEKIEKMESIGVRNLILIPFDQALSNLSPQNFVENYLLKPLNPSMICLGYDHKFGKDRKGNIDTVKSKCLDLDMNTEVLTISEFKSTLTKVNSTSIRNLILEGNMTSANELLGYQYRLEGLINRIGQYQYELKLNESKKLTPKNGIYQVKIQYEKQEFENEIKIISNENPILKFRMETEYDLNLVKIIF